MLLSELAAGASSAQIELSVGYLEDRDGSPAATRLRSRGIEPTLAQIKRPHPLLSRSEYLMVRRHLAEVRPDVLHTHLGYADTLGGFAARSLKIPAVSTIHLIEWERRPHNARDYTRERLMSLARRRYMKAVIAPSEAARQAYLGMGWDKPERVVTVHNGIVAQAQPGTGRAVRHELGLKADDLVAVMLSVLRLRKGHDIATKAVRTLRERFPQLKLLVVGDGPDRVAIEEATAPLGPAAVLAGHRDDVMRVLDAADILLHPSEVDAFPTALLEGMAAGLPIVATATGGIPEIVADQVTGVLIEAPPRSERLIEALRPLLENRELRRQFGARGKERFEHEFTAERWAGRVRVVYEAALSA
jgi:glycosyltransferase involved in cell wall biosynthesis